MSIIGKAKENLVDFWDDYGITIIAFAGCAASLALGYKIGHMDGFKDCALKVAEETIIGMNEELEKAKVTNF